jgi:tripartite-type tricarboxylate transporter receptor subunit TctC
MRQIGQQLRVRWGQPVVVDNRPGAGLTIGTAIAAKSAPDGYTLLMSDRTAIAVAPSLHKRLPYDPLKDLAPITLVAVTSHLLFAHPSFPPANLREFIDHAKRHPGAVNMGVSGPGTANHIASELFKHVTGINVVLVQYKGGGTTIMGVVSGETMVAFNTVPPALPYVRSGKVKAYAYSGKNRFAGAPDIPTMAEAGLPGFESEYWVGMFAPAGVAAPLVARISRDVVDIVKTPAMEAALLAQGAEPSPKRPAEFAEFIRSDTVEMKKIVDPTGMRAE